jgi:GT2 family glycosyltransferase
MKSARTSETAAGPGAARAGPAATRAVAARPASELSVLVAIVNYRAAELVVDCLASLAEEARTLRMHVVVVDNASQDGSSEHIGRAIEASGWSGWVELRALQENGGFSAGNNAAIADACERPDGPDYVLLLNPDTRARPGAVTALLEFMEARPEVGIAGSRLEDEDGTQQHSRYRFPSALGELEACAHLGLLSRLLADACVAPPLDPHARECDWVAGASMIVRRAVVCALGPMDERYFLYYEEVDYCRRARELGWRTWYVPASRVVHLVGRSSGVTSRGRVQARRPGYWFASRRRYFVTHHGRAFALLADAGWVAGHVVWTMRRFVQRKPAVEPPCLGRDFVHFNFLSRAGWGALR